MTVNDNIYNILDSSTTPISQKLRHDRRLLNISNGYTKEEANKATAIAWNKRLLNIGMDNSWTVRNERFLPTGISRRDTRNIVQLLTGQGSLGFFLYAIGWCDSPICICEQEEEISDHFLLRCSFYQNLREAEEPRDLDTLKQSNSWEIWQPTLNFIRNSKRFDI